MIINLKGKTALVCGASQGIGNAIAMGLAKAGANVILLARNEERLKSALGKLDSDHEQKHAYIIADLNNVSSLKNALQNYFSHATESISILVNNTGGPAPGPAHTAKSEEFINAFEQHVICNHILMQAVLPGMKAENYGRIINIISTSVKAPLSNLGVSNTVRAAVANWAKTLANELGIFGITVNNILPGATATGRLENIIKNKAEKTQQSIETISAEMQAEIPMGRFGKPEEIAAAAVFLASPMASYINGINLPVDGGRTPNL